MNFDGCQQATGRRRMPDKDIETLGRAIEKAVKEGRITHEMLDTFEKIADRVPEARNRIGRALDTDVERCREYIRELRAKLAQTTAP